MLISFKEMLEKYTMNITGIIHVGAHYGQEVNEYVSHGIIELVLFEPLRESYEILCRNVEHINANIITHQLALGSAENIANMYVSSNQKQSSSLLKPKDHLVCHSDVQFLGLEEVKVDLLDNFNYTGYNFLAMDVQGYELEVLKGARKTLEYVDYVYAEVNRAEVYEGNAFVEDLDNFLTEYNMKRVETVWPGGIWGDALYIRT